MRCQFWQRIGRNGVVGMCIDIRIEKAPLRTTSKRQMYLYRMVKSIFPNDSVHLNYSPPSKRMELDIFVTSHSLAFEYQGPQHYHQSALHILSLKRQKSRDAEKRQARGRSYLLL